MRWLALKQCPLHAGASKQTKKAKRTEDLDLDDFLNGGFMAVDADKEQLSDSGETTDEDDTHPLVEGDEEQDAFEATNAAADEASDSDGMLRQVMCCMSITAQCSCCTVAKKEKQRAVAAVSKQFVTLQQRFGWITRS